ncbi:MAG: hypothetical protein IT529_15900 [Burkholderiales bacterium]|nr:hypothetical protein [Burkholderiales bacterium]
MRVINPFAPGGGLDLVLRPVLTRMSESLKQSFVLMTHPSPAARNVRELVALAKRRPG